MKFLRPTLLKSVTLSLSLPLALSAQSQSNESVSTPQVRVYNTASGGQTYAFDKGLLRDSSEVFVETGPDGKIWTIGFLNGKDYYVQRDIALKVEDLETNLIPGVKRFAYAQKQHMHYITQPLIVQYSKSKKSSEPQAYELSLKDVVPAGPAISGNEGKIYRPEETEYVKYELISNWDKRTMNILEYNGLVPLKQTEVVAKRPADFGLSGRVLKEDMTLSGSEALSRLQITKVPTSEAAKDLKNDNEIFMGLFDFDYSFLSPAQTQPDEIAQLKAQMSALLTRVEVLEAHMLRQPPARHLDLLDGTEAIFPSNTKVVIPEGHIAKDLLEKMEKNREGKN